VSLAALPGWVAALTGEGLRNLAAGPGDTDRRRRAVAADRSDHDWWRFTPLTALAFCVYAIGFDTSDSYLYLIPAWTAAALWLAVG
jgi:hypothetical protein